MPTTKGHTRDMKHGLKRGHDAVTTGTQFLAEGTRVTILEIDERWLEDPRGNHARVHVHGRWGLDMYWLVRVSCLRPVHASEVTRA